MDAQAETSKSGFTSVLPESYQGLIRTDESDGTAAVEVAPGFLALRALAGRQNNFQDIQKQGVLPELPDAGSLEFEKPEDVCGNDDRVRITATTSTPWRRICQLRITRADGSGARGTGWLYGPRCVITAGHCVYSHTAGGWAQRIEVIPGLDSPTVPYGSQTSTDLRSVAGWTTNADPNDRVLYDYGAIILPNDTFGRTLGYFGAEVLSDGALSNLLVNTAGYPGDKPYGTLWFNSGTITQVQARRLLYLLDTYGGQSGSCVWRLSENVRRCVGIHGYGGCPNKAVRVIQSVFDRMNAWRAL